MNKKREKIKEKQKLQAERMLQLKEAMKNLRKQERMEENYEIIACVRGMMEKGESIDVVLEEIKKGRGDADEY